MSDGEGVRRGQTCVNSGFPGQGKRFFSRHLRVLVSALLLAVASPALAQMALPGKFDVTDTGSASYAIPLSVVPGTAGVEPKLSLSYDSRSGNGLLGVGWSLEGLPAVTRCARTIVQDGVRGGVNYDGDDRFCLEGERLVAITGTYGADGTEYRTEREGFSRIVSYGTAGTGPAWFKVWTKAGLVLEFGNTADSRIEAAGKSEARLWAVSRTADTKGNYFTVSYTEDNTNGEYRPERIDYTGNTVATVTPYASVRFVYETRPDVVPFYQGGSVIKTTQRLTTVQTYNAETLVREYRLAFDQSPSTQRSRVTGVSLCDGNDTCLPATTVVSADGGSGFLPYHSPQPAADWTSSSAAKVVSGDFNGDGRTDIAAGVAEPNGGIATYLSLGNGTFVATVSIQVDVDYISWSDARVFPGDFNGDGLTDISVNNFQQGGIATYFSNGDGTFAGVYESQTGHDWISWPSSNPTHTFALDFDGDGKSDQGVISYGLGGIATYKSNGDGTYVASYHSQTGTDWASWPSAKPVIGDFNGDGMDDIAVGAQDLGGIATYFSNGDGTFDPVYSTQTGSDWASWPNANLFGGDFNGDGKTDIAVYSTTLGGISTYTSKGDGAYIPCYSSQTGQDWISWPSVKPIVGDFNSDGKSDIAVGAYGLGGIGQYLSQGDGTFQATYFDQTGSDWVSWPSARLFSVDFNGDGISDIAVTAENLTGISTYKNEGLFPDLVTSIANGVGAVTEITHESLSAGEQLYAKGDDVLACTYPCVDIQGPIYVVSEVRSANGVGGEFVSSYRYGKARSDLLGRGFLGFARMTVRDEQSGIEQATTYRQDWPYLGLVLRRVKTLDTAELNRTRNDYGATDLGAGRYFPYLTETTEWSYEPDGTSLPATTTTYQYDAWGNTTHVEVSTHADDGRTRTTVNTYDNDETNWLLGRLTRSEVTSADYTGSGAPVDEDDPDLEPSSIDVTIASSVDNPDIAALAMAAGWDGTAPGRPGAADPGGRGGRFHVRIRCGPHHRVFPRGLDCQADQPGFDHRTRRSRRSRRVPEPLGREPRWRWWRHRGQCPQSGR